MKPRSELRRRQQAEADRRAAIAKELSTPRRYAVERPDIDLQAIVRDVAALDPKRRHRDPQSHVLRFRTKDKGKITSALVNYAYKRFPVPACLETVWHDPPMPRLAGTRLAGPLLGTLRAGSEARLRRMRRWYLTVASGGSLFKEHTSLSMTRKETHRFLNSPAMTFEGAIVFAIAQSHTDSRAICHRLSQSKIAQREMISDVETTPADAGHAVFWRDVVRFLAQHELSLSAINDMIDFLTHARGLDPDYSLTRLIDPGG